MSRKGVSIGAALRRRMQPEEEGVPERAPAPQPEAAPEPVRASDPGVPEAEPLEAFNTRLKRSLQRRLKVYSAQSGQKIQEVVNQALDEFLSSKND